MPCRLLFALAVLSALAGCVSEPPKGTFVEYREGGNATTQPVKREATYVLRAVALGAGPLAEHRVAEGEQLGFRRGSDGSVVAVAPGYSIPLAPGDYRWEVVAGSETPWHERAFRKTRDNTGGAVSAVGLSLGFIGYCLMRILTGMAR